MAYVKSKSNPTWDELTKSISDCWRINIGERGHMVAAHLTLPTGDTMEAFLHCDAPSDSHGWRGWQLFSNYCTHRELSIWEPEHKAHWHDVLHSASLFVAEKREQAEAKAQADG